MMATGRFDGYRALDAGRDHRPGALAAMRSPFTTPGDLAPRICHFDSPMMTAPESLLSAAASVEAA